MSVPTPVPYEAAAALARATELLAPWTDGPTTPEPARLDVVVRADDLRAAVAALAGGGWRLSAITGLDLKAKAGGARPAGRAPAAAATAPTTDDLEVLYHFCAGPAVLTMRLRVARATPVVPSLHGVLGYAGFYERELHELFGVEVEGAPNLDRLLLSDDWPSDVFPLRKDAVMPPLPTS